MHLTYPKADIASSGDRPTLAEIAVTPEMVAAGVAAFSAFDVRFGDPEEMVAEIYRRMATAKNTGLNC